MRHLRNNVVKNVMFFALLSLFACKNQKDSTSTVRENNADLFSSQKVTLSFERTICFGTCPAFRVVVLNDGTSYYEGKKFVDLEGTYKAKIDKNQMESIFNEAKKIGFQELDDEYDDAGVTDVPTTITSISFPEGIKRIRDRFNGPESLHDFERFLDGVLLNLEWKETDEVYMPESTD